MKKYQIVEITENLNHAGSKATADFAKIADECGYERVNICMNTSRLGKVAKVQRQIGYYFDWNKCYKVIEPNAWVVLQHPFHYPQLTREGILTKLKEKKKVKYISVIHDVEELRQFMDNKAYYQQEFEFMLKITDVMIVHNEKMMEFFIQKGVDRKKLVNLEIFDYLQKNNAEKCITFAKTITIAGNLDTTKCKYIGKLDKIKNIQIDLYGPNLNKKLNINENIHYKGVLSPDKVPNVLTSGFGLVWDGDGIRGGMGQAGKYIAYNNPHKLSLYLSSGLPVIIWKGAAEAGFVSKHNLGILVNSLDELSDILPNMSESEYMKMVSNVKELSKKLVSGYFGKKAILKAEKLLKR